MFVVKWIMVDGSEKIFGGKEIKFTPAERCATKRPMVTFYNEEGTECSFDTGRVYVVNDLGKTVANYSLGDLPAAA
jgi:hypothetical protein